MNVYHLCTVLCGLTASDSLAAECAAEEEWDVIDGAICFPSSSAATHEQPRTSGAVCMMEREKEEEGRQSKGERMGFYATVNRDSHLFSRLNVCKFHLQTAEQILQHRKLQFYGLPALEIFSLQITLIPLVNSLVLHRWGFCRAVSQIVRLF